MSRFILGVHASHNASACIGDANGVLFAAQEERYTGEKNYWGFPRNAIRACMEAVSATPADIEAVAYGSTRVLSRYHDRFETVRAYKRYATLSGRIRQEVVMPTAMALLPRYGQTTLRTLLAEVGLGDHEIGFHDHHLAHAATAYFGLRADPETPYLVLSCDGVGDRLCATVNVMGGGDLRRVTATGWGNSIGQIYSWVTYLMGFVPLEHEYKLMGMAPYASPEAAERAADVFRKHLGLDGSGLRFRRKGLPRTNGRSARLLKDIATMRFDHVAAGLQRFTEELLVTWTANAVAHTGIGDVLAGGGVFMNVKANKTIAELPAVRSFQAFPSCGDETLPLGAFYLEAARRFEGARLRPIENFYLGDAPAPDEIERSVRASGFHAERPADVAGAVADIMVSGHPVARCDGPMEFGARALGNRSILADPRNQDVVRVINQMIKQRDFWMPFAPMVLDRRQHEYLVNPKELPSPYMMMTFDSRENFRDLIAAVHNADLTCRAQILRREQNPAMYDILEAFEARTGRGVVLNTSFNLHGFPIVRTPEDALSVFRESGLEYLQLGQWIVRKAPVEVSVGSTAGRSAHGTP